MPGLLLLAIGILLGMLIGIGITYFVLEQRQQHRLVQTYESRIQTLQADHQQALKQARAKSTDTNRLDLKGKIAEQEDERLARRFQQQVPLQELVKGLQSQPSAIRSRLKTLGLLP